ncbi:MAG: O-antigen ligase family protein [Bacteroides sp.]|nr:O-antigen ligase family protein [Bacteroides sp.]
MLKQIKYYIFCAELLCPQLFSALSSLTGRKFAGSEGDSSYILFCAMLAVLSIGIIYYEFIRFSVKLSPKHILILLLLPLTILCIYILEQTPNIRAKQMILQFMIWGIPSITIGVYLSINHTINQFKFPLIIYAVLIIIGLVKSWFFSFTESLLRESDSGETYQAAAYSSAICYGIFLYFFIFKESLPKSLIRYKIVCIPLMILCIGIILLTGGRGGMVLTIIYTFTFLYIYQKKFHISLTTKLKVAIGIIISIMIIVQYVNNDPVLSQSSQRVFSYISDGGIDMSKTSHRDEAYSKAITNWNLSPYFGYGIFKYYEVNHNYPHNFFLEILLQGGVILFAFYLVLLGLYLYKFAKIMHYVNNTIFLIIFLYPFINLMFSGTYIGSADFWFCVAYVVCYRLPSHNLKLSLYEQKHITYCQ